tara:strand:- start:1592 stop:2458 length:867 start_codon:yes stop_codon:yes gene_type:complete
MSIKQNGGVFGRNPTFNDVTIEGQLTFDGDIDINSDLKVDGDLDVTGSGSFASLDVFSAGIKTNSNAAVGFQLGGDSSGSGAIGNIINNAGRFAIEPASTRSFAIRTGATKADSLVVDHNNHVKISTGNLVIGTSGKGIDFSATSGTGTSELLDDYEEGVHTTAATCTTSGTIGFVSSNNQLAYTKIGNTVHVSGYLYVNAISSPVGGVQISLPFTAADLADKGGASVASLYLTNVVASNVSDFVGKIDEGNDFLLMYLGNSNAVQATSAQQIKAGSQIYISITYKTA